MNVSDQQEIPKSRQRLGMAILWTTAFLITVLLQGVATLGLDAFKAEEIATAIAMSAFIFLLVMLFGVLKSKAISSNTKWLQSTLNGIGTLAAIANISGLAIVASLTLPDLGKILNERTWSSENRALIVDSCLSREERSLGSGIGEDVLSNSGVSVYCKCISNSISERISYSDYVKSGMDFSNNSDAGDILKVCLMSASFQRDGLTGR